MDQEQIVAEIRRVASMLQTPYLSRQQFGQHSHISVSVVGHKFGNWARALEAAGLKVSPPSGSRQKQAAPDDVYLHEIIRLTRELGKRPTTREFELHGRFSLKPYKSRWSTFTNACQIAYATYGFPDVVDPSNLHMAATMATPSAVLDHILQDRGVSPPRRKKVQFGEPLDFRGLRFAPINEQGVVYLFGMVSRELGFLVESIRTDYPDCEGKRCVDSKRQRWEHVLIEFEYQSSNFRAHGHNAEACDIIVCWVHDWHGCPVEVLELSSEIRRLPHRPNFA